MCIKYPPPSFLLCFTRPQAFPSVVYPLFWAGLQLVCLLIATDLIFSLLRRIVRRRRAPISLFSGYATPSGRLSCVRGPTLKSRSESFPLFLGSCSETRLSSPYVWRRAFLGEFHLAGVPGFQKMSPSFGSHADFSLCTRDLGLRRVLHMRIPSDGGPPPLVPVQSVRL